MPTNHGSIEFLKFPNPAHKTDNTQPRFIKKWLRDSWARRKILALQQAIAAIVVPTASTANPQMDGTAAPGVSTDYARADHVHPHDSSKADAATTYTKSQIDAMIPSVPSASTSNPAMDGTASAGSSAAWARGDHVHPHDTSKADKATTLAGYGITDAYTKTQVDGMIPTVPTNVSAFTNDAGYLTSAPVTSVNSQTGAVNLTASDVGALPSSTAIPSKTSDLTNDSGFITGEKFAVITCTLASSNTYGAYTALPTGFTKDNCVMLVIQVPDGSGERIGQGIFTTTNMRLFAEMTTSGVRIYNNTSRYYGVDVKVVLMRTDI